MRTNIDKLVAELPSEHWPADVCMAIHTWAVGKAIEEKKWANVYDLLAPWSAEAVTFNPHRPKLCAFLAWNIQPLESDLCAGVV